MKKLLFLSLFVCSLHAAQIDADLGIGYRSDWINITTFVDNDFDSDLKFDQFDMLNFEGSFRGDFDYFVLMADGSYARFWNGREEFRLTVPVLPLAPNSFDLEDQLKLKTAGYATSASGGGGFLIPIIKREWINFLIIPKAGYRRDNIRMKQMNPRPDPTAYFNLPNSVIVSLRFFDLSQQKFELTYEGPFFGGDVELEISKFKLQAGYTYHWPRARETAKLDGLIMEFATNPAANAALNVKALVNSTTKKNRGHMFKGKVIYQVLKNFYLSANGKYIFYKKTGSSSRTTTRQLNYVYVPFVASFSDLSLDQFQMNWQFFSVVFETGVSF